MEHSDIAIVGMSCRFAGCSTSSALWDAVMSSRSCLTVPGPDTEIPLGTRKVFDRPYPTRLGQLGELYSCVQAMQTFPRQINAGENQDLYFATQLAFDALVDAGMKPKPNDPVRGSIRLGYAPPFNSSTVNWLQHTAFLDQTMDILQRFMPNAPESALDDVKSKLRDSLPAPNVESFLLGSGFRFVSWIARECSFSGAATITDAGNLTGAAALMEAMRDLRCGDVDVALVGAVNPPLSRAYLEGLAGEIRFTARAWLHPFSSDDDGTIPGEGGAFFLLKRREDALRDRDRIYALVKSVAIGHNPENDPSVMLANAMESAKADAKSIDLIEADGSGVLGPEEREIEAVQRIWGYHRPGGPLVGIGSVKGNVGHCLKASIAASLVKTALALRYRVLPPQLTPEHVNEKLSHLASSAYLLTEARPWITGDSSSPRRAAVLGANFDPGTPRGNASHGGRSAAIILEEEPENRI
ncbi:MAG: polyketide synthase [Lentisphaerae bacterium]|nr:polyketide synthase [Lentisphaerota bacterium]